MVMDADIGPPSFCPTYVGVYIGKLGGKNVVRADEVMIAER